MTTHPDLVELGEEDLERTAQVVGRGLYFFDQLAPPIIDGRVSDRHHICDVAYHIRSLAEVSSGMPLWFRNIDNIQALSGATLIDFNHLLVRAFKAKKDAGKPLSEFENRVLSDASDKYFALCYPDGKTQLKSFRRDDECLLDTNMITSKLLHQDEFSIFGSLGPGGIATGVHLKKLANFWRKNAQPLTFTLSHQFFLHGLQLLPSRIDIGELLFKIS